MARQVPWNDPAVVRVMEDYPTEEINTQRKLARRIWEMTGVSVSRPTINRRLCEMRRAPNTAAPSLSHMRPMCKH